MKQYKIFEKIKDYFIHQKNNLLKLIFFLLAIIIINNQWSNLSFTLQYNDLFLWIIVPFSFIAFLLYKRNIFGSKASFWAVISIFVAILFFMLQNADLAASKTYLIYSANTYNCGVSGSILSLNGANTRENLVLQFFVTDPYFINADLIFKNYGWDAGMNILKVAFKMQTANTLLSMIRDLNVQGADSNQIRNGDFIDKYNNQAIGITKEIWTSLDCDHIKKPSNVSLLQMILSGLTNTYFISKEWLHNRITIIL